MKITFDTTAEIEKLAKLLTSVFPADIIIDADDLSNALTSEDYELPLDFDGFHLPVSICHKRTAPDTDTDSNTTAAPDSTTTNAQNEELSSSTANESLAYTIKSPLQKRYDPDEIKKAFQSDRVFWHTYLKGVRKTSYDHGCFDTFMQLLKDDFMDYEDVAKYLDKSTEMIVELYHLWCRMSNERLEKGETPNENPDHN